MVAGPHLGRQLGPLSSTWWESEDCLTAGPLSQRSGVAFDLWRFSLANTTTCRMVSSGRGVRAPTLHLPPRRVRSPQHRSSLRTPAGSSGLKALPLPAPWPRPRCPSGPLQPLHEWVSARGGVNFVPRGTCDKVWRHFWCFPLKERGVQPSASGWRSGTLPPTLCRALGSPHSRPSIGRRRRNPAVGRRPLAPGVSGQRPGSSLSG